MRFAEIGLLGLILQGLHLDDGIDLLFHDLPALRDAFQKQLVDEFLIQIDGGGLQRFQMVCQRVIGHYFDAVLLKQSLHVFRDLGRFNEQHAAVLADQGERVRHRRRVDIMAAIVQKPGGGFQRSDQIVVRFFLRHVRAQARKLLYPGFSRIGDRQVEDRILRKLRTVRPDFVEEIFGAGKVQFLSLKLLLQTDGLEAAKRAAVDTDDTLFRGVLNYIILPCGHSRLADLHQLDARTGQLSLSLEEITAIDPAGSLVRGNDHRAGGSGKAGDISAAFPIGGDIFTLMRVRG